MDLVTAFDTETTGLIDNRVIKIVRQPHVIEFYGCMVDIDSGEISSEIDLLIRPPSERDLTEEITTITGITWPMVEDKPLFHEVSDQIFKFIEESKCVVAHNLSFDMEMVEIEAERIGRKILWPRRKICTVEQTVYVKGFRLNLSSLYEMLFGEKFTGAHRAKVDVAAMVRCCLELRKRGMI